MVRDSGSRNADARSVVGGGREPRQERGERTRRGVLEAVLRLVAKRGLGDVTFRAVAEEADVSLGVTTYYFSSRDDMLVEALKLHLAHMHERSHALEAAEGAAWRVDTPDLERVTDSVMQFFGAMVREERDSFIAGQELTLALMRDSDFAARLRDALEEHQRVTASLVERTGASEPELDSELLAAAFEGLALKWLSRDTEPEEMRRLVRRLMQLFLAQREA